jgi:hypothetical protein
MDERLADGCPVGGSEEVGENWKGAWLVLKGVEDHGANCQSPFYKVWERRCRFPWRNLNGRIGGTVESFVGGGRDWFNRREILGEHAGTLR